MNEAPVFDVSNATSTVAENAAQGTTIFTASATDPDSIKSIVYSIPQAVLTQTSFKLMEKLEQLL